MARTPKHETTKKVLSYIVSRKELGEFPPVGIEIADEMNISNQSAMYHLDKLEYMGYIERLRTASGAISPRSIKVIQSRWKV